MTTALLLSFYHTSAKSTTDFCGIIGNNSDKKDWVRKSCEGRIFLQLYAAFYIFLGNPGTIRAPQHTFLQNGLHTAAFTGRHKSGHHGHHFRKSSRTEHHRKQEKCLENTTFSRLLWRRRWDSNPRALADYLISSD